MEDLENYREKNEKRKQYSLADIGKKIVEKNVPETIKDTERMNKLKQHVLGLRESNKQIVELLESVRPKEMESEKRPSFEFGLKRR